MRRRLTLLKLPRHIFDVLVPRATGDERGNTDLIRGCPRNCERIARVIRPLGNREGQTQLSDDPRARRPASAVTQPVDGASIRSGLSQR